jgi:hypothetical protein
MCKVRELICCLLEIATDFELLAGEKRKTQGDGRKKLGSRWPVFRRKAYAGPKRILEK